MSVEGLSFEEALGQLEDAVKRLESGNLSLDESLGLFERGMQLAAYCEELLDAAELRLRQVVPAPDGGYDLADLDDEVGDPLP